MNDTPPHTQNDEILAETMAKIGSSYIVLSGKGGVGKTTVAVNLAVSLAARGMKTGLLDVDLHGPSATVLLGMQSARLGPDPAGGIAPITCGDNLQFVSIGLLLQNQDDAVIWRGPMKYKVIRQFLEEVSWGTLDCLVIDAPPGTGDEPLSVAQLARPAAAVIVTTPQDVALADVRKSISFCNSLSLPVAGVIENMSGLDCPHCGREIRLFSSGGGEQLAAEFDIPFLGRLPLDPAVVASGDRGRPFVSHEPASGIARTFEHITDTLLNGTPEKQQENATMRIAIPTADGKLCMHFGHCQEFALVDVDDTEKRVRDTSYHSPPAHEPGALPRWLKEQSANVVIAGGMGRRAQAIFSENGIDVIVGAAAETPEAIAESYLQGTLETGNNVCDH